MFPYDFGFVPSTRGEDGDPLDLLALLDEPTFVGCVVPVRLVGVILAKQIESNGKMVRNDRLIAVAVPMAGGTSIPLSLIFSMRGTENCRTPPVAFPA